MRNWEAFVRERLSLSEFKPEREKKIIREVAAQLEDFYREALSRGMTETEADAYARRQIKDWECFASDVRRFDRPHRHPRIEQWEQKAEIYAKRNGGGWNMFADLIKDISYGMRMLRRNPGFTAVAVLTLALGIGANTAIFSVVNAVLLRPLPYPEPERLVRSAGQDSYPDIQDWRKQGQTVEAFGAYMRDFFDLTSGPEPERINGGQVMGDLFSLFGVDALLGRTLQEEDGKSSGANLAVISYDLWQRLYQGDDTALGKSLSLSGKPYTIVGVMPAGFQFPSAAADVWLPLAEDNGVVGARGAHTFRAFGRLKPDTTLADAQSEMNVIAERLATAYPDTNTDIRYTLVPLLDSVVDSSRNALLILFGAVSAVLLIACANVANLILARSSARQKETAVRMALGASRNRVLRQWLTETSLLFLAGGVAGVVVATRLLPVLLALSPGRLPRVEEIGLDWRVLGFSLAVSIVAGVLFGLHPAWSAGQVNVAHAMKEGGRTISHSRKKWFRNGLVVTEVALALVLLTGAGLMVRSMSHLITQEPGFNPERLVTFNLTLTKDEYKEVARRTRFYDDMISRLQTIPGVEAVATSTDFPLEPNYYVDHNFIIEGRPEVPLGETPSLVHRGVNPGYHQALGIPLLKGRHIEDADRANTFPVAVINQAAVREFFPDEDPVGKRFRWAFADTVRWITIAGVVGDVRDFGLDTNDRSAAYLPYAQEQAWWRTWNVVALRTSVPTASLIEQVKGEIAKVDPLVPIADVRTMDKLVEDSYALRRFSLQLLGGFAVVALALAMIGIYGVISQEVRQRTHEIGLRLALGAQRGDVLRLIVGHGLRLTLAGLALGLLGSLALTRLLQTLLFGVSPTDPVTFVGVSFLLTAVALLASYIPARRAAKVDPMVALRYE